MFNTTATAVNTLRPGMIAGDYPERQASPVRGVERFLQNIYGRTSGIFVTRQADLHRQARMTRSTGDGLTSLSDAALKIRVDTLRQSFERQGLSDALCIEAFALVREWADRVLAMRHYDVQVMGAWAMLKGRVAEMATGEGKTLTATLTAATAALAGIPVHILTVNEYLVKRDATAMGPIYRSLGLSVGYVTEQMAPEQRRHAYSCDIVYCTNKQVAFDYLRDRLLLGNQSRRLQRKLETAYRTDPPQRQLLLRGLCFAIVDEADSVLIDEARTPLILTRPLDTDDQRRMYRWALRVARQLQPEQGFYYVGQSIQISQSGQEQINAETTSELRLTPRRSEEVVRQALHALHLLQRDRDYLVNQDKVFIIDANTGRTMPDRSWEKGLQQLVELKEHCPLTPERVQLARFTYQRFFSRYLHLSGMTGTAREISGELNRVYQLHVQTIPLHRPNCRRQLPPQMHLTRQAKWAAVIKEIAHIHELGRPILIGTSSVADSEALSVQLATAGLPHQVLNARQDRHEADIVASAGLAGQITIATNMAGRGTDIELGAGVAAAGGLHVVTTCRNNAARIDRQLHGRSARQGDPGSYRDILSLEDHVDDFGRSPWPLRVSAICAVMVPVLLKPFGLTALRRVQAASEKQQRDARRLLLRQDRQLNQQLAFSGRPE